MGLQLTRVISALVLFIGTFVCGIAPAITKWYVFSWRKVTRRANEEKWIIKQSKIVTSFFMCFGGGVLFSTCFIHLLPELRSTFEDYWERESESGNSTRTKSENHSHKFPLPEFIMCGGFLSVYALEEVIYYIICKFHDVELPQPYSQPPHYNQQCRNSVVHSNHTEGSPKEESDDLIESDNNKSGYGTVPVTTEEQCIEPFRPQMTPALVAQESQIILFKSGLSLRGILAVVALSFHSLFEGLSVGMQRTESEIWTLLFAISIHKFVIAVVIGIETVQANTAIKVVIPYMLIFSLMSPIGMFTAVIAYNTTIQENPLIYGSLIALATGTLIYVTFFEILLKERNSELSGNWQLLGMFVGFISMTLIDSLSVELHSKANA